MGHRGLSIAITVAAVAVQATSASAGAAHPFHITIAEADYNKESGTLEVALRIYNPGDLEEALGLRAGERVNLETTEGVDDLIAEYLDETLIVEDASGEKAAIEWVGKEVTVKTAWLYFEVPLPEGPEGSTFTNTLLFEVEPDQSNTMVFGRGDDRASLRFTRERRTLTLGQAEGPDDGAEAVEPGR